MTSKDEFVCFLMVFENYLLLFFASCLYSCRRTLYINERQRSSVQFISMHCLVYVLVGTNNGGCREKQMTERKRRDEESPEFRDASNRRRSCKQLNGIFASSNFSSFYTFYIGFAGFVHLSPFSAARPGPLLSSYIAMYEESILSQTNDSWRRYSHVLCLNFPSPFSFIPSTHCYAYRSHPCVMFLWPQSSGPQFRGD